MRDPIPSTALLKDIPDFEGFPKEGERFLVGLGVHNEKVWFDAHRAEYEQHVLGPMRAFVLEAGQRLRKKVPRLVADPRVGGSIFRLARDTRFSSDKTPYKTWSAARLWDASGPGKDTSTGFYVHLQPGEAWAGGGLYQFEDEQLARWRRALQDPKPLKALKAVLAKLKDLELGGRTLKRYPRGFTPDEAAGELALHKGLYVGTGLDLRRARTAKALDDAVAIYLRIVPLNAWLLTHVVHGPKVR